jgi:FtsP/CotA-like multicopper oxidase with cupredoxin domain
MKKIQITFLIMCLPVLLQAQQVINYSLYMRNISDKTMWDGTVLRVFGFASNIGNVPVPGPTLYCNEGDTLNVYVMNISQGNPHTIHWHGLDVPQNMDGVMETSFDIMHMMDTNLVFAASHAGTDLYHCHVASVVHVQMGMYGSVIVRPADGSNTTWTGGQPFHHDHLWLMSEMDKYWHDSLPQADSVHEGFMVPPYEPDYFLVNGNSQQQIVADTNTAFDGMQGEKIYLRLSNIGYTMNQVIFPASFQAEILSSDGRPLPFGISADTIYVMPGERYEVMLSPSAQDTFNVNVNYLDVNTRSVLGTEIVPIIIAGVIGREPAQTSQGNISVFPNPADGFIQLEWNKMGKGTAEIQLIDLAGQTILSTASSGENGSAQIVTESVAAGYYLLRWANEFQMYTLPVVITH